MLFVLGAQDAVHGVRGTATRFVVVTDLHLSKQADGEQIQATEQEAESSHHQRAVFAHYRDVAQEFLQAEPEHDAAATEDTHHPDAAEEVQWA